MVDRPKVDSLLLRLKLYLGELRRLARLGREALLADPDKVASAKYHFVVAIECCIDIANHVIASERLRMPEDYADSFSILVEAKLCPLGLEEPLRAMAKFRNRLVHLYWDVKDDFVASYLERSLDDFDRFARAVSALPG